MKKLMTVIVMALAFLFAACDYAMASGPPTAVSDQPVLRSKKQIVPVQPVAVKDVDKAALLSNKQMLVKERVGQMIQIRIASELHTAKELAGYRTVEDKPKIYTGIGGDHFARADV